jgi:predicted CoA-binding protein
MATQSTRADVENFVGQHKLAVVGVSRDTKKFGNAAYKALKEKGYQVYPINWHPFGHRVQPASRTPM